MPDFPPPLALLVAAAVTAAPSGVGAEQLPPAPAASSAGWDAPEARDLVARARVARAERAASAELASYTARTEGHIYFFLDPEEGGRHLLRVDQIAADVRWQSPGILQQHIVGERSRRRFPLREFAYYLDRFTLVPHGFAEEIRIGLGEDVAGVEHPLAAWRAGSGVEEVYHFRLGNTLSLFLPGEEEPVRIRELFVRPRDTSRPGILGVIHLDLATASIVRMAFTFTSASYVDPRNDRVHVELDYGLWEGRHWLANLQRIEVRREVPGIDLEVGTVIRAVLEVRDYELDAAGPDDLALLPPVTFEPPDERAAYPFSTGVYDRMEAHGLGPVAVDTDPEELRSRALEWARDIGSSGLSPVRFHLDGFSSLLRYNRVEGLSLGAGGSYHPRPAMRVRARAGHAFGSGKPRFSIGFEEVLDASWTLRLEGFLRRRADLGLAPGSSPLVSSIGALLLGEDYVDTYWMSGGRIGLDRRGSGRSRITFGFGLERHTSASRLVASSPLGDRAFRSVRSVSEAEFLRLDAGTLFDLPAPGGGTGVAELSATALYGQAGGGIGILTGLEERWHPGGPSKEIALSGTGWIWLGDPLPQGHRLMGGRGTLPGHAYRGYAGRVAVAGGLVGSSDIIGPLVRARAGLHLGWSDGGDPVVGQSWAAGGTSGIAGAVSAGLGLGWDLIRVALARGIGAGEWQLWISLDPNLWDRM